jgi:hypothetical protein
MNADKTKAIVLLLILLSVIASAQTPLATVTGLATDPAGAAVTTVTITLSNKDTGVERTGRTNDSGAFSFPNFCIPIESPKALILLSP